MTLNDDVVIIGDLNMNCLMPNNPSQKWLGLMDMLNFSQLITRQTRLIRKAKSFIDHIYFYYVDKMKESRVSLNAISDHYPVCVTQIVTKRVKKG